MFGLVILVVFGAFIFSAYKRGAISKNRAIGSYVMIFIATFIGPLVTVIGWFGMFAVAILNAWWTPKVIENFLNDRSKK